MNRIVKAEATVLRHRRGPKALLAVAALIPLLVVIGYSVLASQGESGLQFNGQPLSQLVSISGQDAAALALHGRNFFVMPLLLLFIAGQSLASERSSHVLREQLLRPVARTRVLWSKVVVLWALSILSVAVNAVVGLGLGGAVLGAGGEWGPVLLAHAAAVGSDLGIILFGFMLSSMLRSAAGVMAVGLMLLGLDWAIRMGLSALGFMGLDSARTVLLFMPGSGLDFYRMEGGVFSLEAFACLVVWSGLLGAIAHRRMGRMDTP
jgi:ABC-type transport system involved in multi-copper enzyme maturation permease subunit